MIKAEKITGTGETEADPVLVLNHVQDRGDEAVELIGQPDVVHTQDQEVFHAVGTSVVTDHPSEIVALEAGQLGLGLAQDLDQFVEALSLRVENDQYHLKTGQGRGLSSQRVLNQQTEMVLKKTDS